MGTGATARSVLGAFRRMGTATLGVGRVWLQRLMVGYATDLELDGHGRVLLPPELREFAKLERHGMLIGQGNRFELWDEARWSERRDQWLKSEEEAGDLPSELDSLKL